MSHPAQIEFCKTVKYLYPEYFRKVNVIDVGSKDINGSNRYLFKKSHYIGVDIDPGKNVDVLGRAHLILPDLKPELDPKFLPYSRPMPNEKVRWCDQHKRIVGANLFDTICSTECLEHDCYIQLTLSVMYDKLRSGGLMFITCGGDDRPEHGTTEHKPQLSPATNEYYCNVSNKMFSGILPPGLFKKYYLAQEDRDHDLQFYGIKK